MWTQKLSVISLIYSGMCSFDGAFWCIPKHVLDTASCYSDVHDISRKITKFKVCAMTIISTRKPQKLRFIIFLCRLFWRFRHHNQWCSQILCHTCTQQVALGSNDVREIYDDWPWFPWQQNMRQNRLFYSACISEANIYIHIYILNARVLARFGHFAHIMWTG